VHDAAGLAPLRILVAEDNPLNQRVTRCLLERDGHTVVVVEHGVAAVEAWRAGGFDLVLMDLEMPEMDGATATRHIREQELLSGEPGFARIPIVALTANVFASDREGCLMVGMDDHLSKPIQLPALRAILARLFPPAGMAA
jgi:CheY-like chemotaxis protein